MHAILVISLLFLASAASLDDNASKERTYLNTFNTLAQALTKTTIVSGPEADIGTCVDPVKNLLNENVTVSVYDLGNFTGIALASEYFCIPTILLTYNTVILSITQGNYEYDNENNEIWIEWSFQAAVRLPNPGCASDPFAAVFSPEKFTVYLEGVVSFDDEDKISYMEVWFGRYLAFLAFGEQFTPQNETEILVRFCSLAFMACQSHNLDLGNVTNGIDAFVVECTEILGEELEVNPSFAGLGSPAFFTNTFACRQAHLPMAFIDPNMHCPHVNLHSTACTAPLYILQA